MRTVLGFSLPEWIALNLAVSAYMTGVIWFVQLVHYPLLQRVGPGGFVEYERQHTRRTAWVVAAPMIFELAACIVLVFLAQTTRFFRSALLSAALVVVIWVSTFALQVPCHNRLERGFEQAVCERLVRTNWVRTMAWSIRTLLLVAMMLKSIHLLAGRLS